MWDLLVL